MFKRLGSRLNLKALRNAVHRNLFNSYLNVNFGHSTTWRPDDILFDYCLLAHARNYIIFTNMKRIYT